MTTATARSSPSCSFVYRASIMPARTIDRVALQVDGRGTDAKIGDGELVGGAKRGGRKEGQCRRHKDACTADRRQNCVPINSTRELAMRDPRVQDRNRSRVPQCLGTQVDNHRRGPAPISSRWCTVFVRILEKGAHLRRNLRAFPRFALVEMAAHPSNRVRTFEAGPRPSGTRSRVRCRSRVKSCSHLLRPRSLSVVSKRIS